MFKFILKIRSEITSVTENIRMKAIPQVIIVHKTPGTAQWFQYLYLSDLC
jgi:hypothetical protein